MSFSDLLKTRDAAIAADVKALAAKLAAEAELEVATLLHTDTVAARAAAHQAIHARLVERGEHYLITEDGTCTVYKPVDVEPGYLAVQPIPGEGPATSAS